MPESTGHRNDIKAHGADVRNLKCTGLATVSGIRYGAAEAVAAATTLVPSDSGKTFLLTQSASAAFAVTLPSTDTIIGCEYNFVLGTASDKVITIVASDAHFIGNLINEGAITAATGTTLTVTADATAGDQVKLRGLSATVIQVVAISSIASGITIT
jgi:hypothetical protein